MTIAETILQPISAKLIKDLKEELFAQGHYLTGRLEKSLGGQVNESGDVAAMEIEGESYLEPLNTGLEPSQIPDGPGYIEGLKQYAKLRFGYGEKQALQTAFAIARKHKREGMPTANSYKFSENNRRTDALNTVIEANDKPMNNLIEQRMESEIDKILGEGFSITI